MYLPRRSRSRIKFFLPVAMSEFSINKGVGKQVEFKGLKAQYIFIFAGGLLGDFILFVIMYMIGIPSFPCILFCVCLGTVLVWYTFRLNAKYGAHGLMKKAAALYFPRRIIHRKRLIRILRIADGTHRFNI